MFVRRFNNFPPPFLCSSFRRTPTTWMRTRRLACALSASTAATFTTLAALTVRPVGGGGGLPIMCF